MKAKILGKRVAAWVLCLVMVLTTINLPAFTKNAKAEEATDTTQGATTCETHTYEYVCLNKNEHIKRCSACGKLAYADKAAHEFLDGECSICGISEDAKNWNYKFVSKEDLVMLSLSESTSDIKVNFGNKGTSAQTWYIAGENADGTLVLVCDCTNRMAGKVFCPTKDNGIYDGEEVYPNHYGASAVRAYLTSDALDNFTDAEKAFMADTDIYTYDTKNKKAYELNDKLYLVYIESGWNYFTVGNNKPDSLDDGFKVSLKSGIYANGKNTCYTRCPDKNKDWTMNMSIGSGSNNGYADWNLDIIPVFHLDSSAILFASAAEVSTNDAQLSDAMTFRMDGSEVITSSVLACGDNISVTKGDADTEFLYVQGNEGASDWVYSMQITENTNVSVESIKELKELSDVDLTKCKLWIEKTDDNVTYAKQFASVGDHDFSDYECVETGFYKATCKTCGYEKESIDYVDVTFDEAGKVSRVPNNLEETFTHISSDMLNLGEEGKTTWYVVKGEVDTEGYVTTNGDVHIILADGCDYKIRQLTIFGSLTIYGQTNQTGQFTIPENPAYHNTIKGDLLTINGGTLDVYQNWNAYENTVINTQLLTINNGNLKVSNGNFANILSSKIVLNGGLVELVNNKNEETGNAIAKNDIIFNGGILRTYNADGVEINRPAIGGTITVAEGWNYKFYSGTSEVDAEYVANYNGKNPYLVAEPCMEHEYVSIESDSTSHECIYCYTKEKHDMTIQAKPGVEETCHSEGKTPVITCSVCSYEVGGETIEMTEHSWDEGEITTVATCVVKGVKTYHCTNEGCDATKTEELGLNADNHVNVKVINVKAATCTEAGYTGDTYCDDCEKVVNAGEEIEATSHSWDKGEITMIPTCVKNGSKIYHCTVEGCNATKLESVEVNPNNHLSTEVINVVVPTCIEEGYSGDIYCKNCMTTTPGEKIQPLGHDWACVSSSEHKCQREGCECQEKHDFIDLDGNNSGDGICTGCGVKNIAVSDIIVEIEELTYNGAEQKPRVTVKRELKDAGAFIGYESLSENVDYMVNYKAESMKNVAENGYEIVITGIGEYAGERTEIWNLKKANPEGWSVILTPPSNTNYDGNVKQATVTAAEGVEGLGEITNIYYKYLDSMDPWVYMESDTIELNPIDVGQYLVYVDIAEGTNYNAVTNMLVGGFYITNELIEGVHYSIPTDVTVNCGDELIQLYLHDSKFEDVSYWIREAGYDSETGMYKTFDAGEDKSGVTRSYIFEIYKSGSASSIGYDNYERKEVSIPVKINHNLVIVQTDNIEGAEKHVLMCTGCGRIFGEEEVCSGGKATCVERAICSSCNKPYGNFVEHSRKCECGVPKKCGENAISVYDHKTETITISGTGEIYAKAFMNATYIKKVVIEEGITDIGNEAFRGCTNLTEIEMPETLIHIADSAFRECTTIELIVLSDSVQQIDNFVFYGCNKLNTIILSDNLSTVGDENTIFGNCSSLEWVRYPGTMKEWRDMFHDKYGNWDLWRENFTASRDCEYRYIKKSELVIDNGLKLKLTFNSEIVNGRAREDMSIWRINGEVFSTIDKVVTIDIEDNFEDDIVVNYSDSYSIIMEYTFRIEDMVKDYRKNETTLELANEIGKYCHEQGADHSFTYYEKHDGTFHVLKCAYCDEVTYGKFHEFVDGVCACGYLEACSKGEHDYVDQECVDVKDGKQHYHECYECGYVEYVEHNFENMPYLCDDDGNHYQLCKECDAESAHEAHYGGTASCTKKAECSVCGTEYGTLLEHNYSDSLVSDKENHWHECSCGAKSDVAAHSLKTTTVTKANAEKSTNGKIETKCSVCGYVSKTTTISYPKTITLSATSCTYDGKEHKPTVKSVVDADGKTIAATNYTVSIVNSAKSATVTPKAAGTYYVKVVFKGDYTGTKYITYKINPKTGNTASISYTSKAYTGSALKPTVTVKNASGTALKSGTDYTVAYLNSAGKAVTPTAVGEYTVKVTMKGNYGGTITKTYKIVPKTTTIGTPVIAADGITVKWTKNTTGAGYYIYRSDNGAAYKKVKTITSNATVSWKDAGAKTNGTKYQYKIVAYKTVSGKTYQSAYSAIKTIYFVSKPAISSLTNSAAGKMLLKWARNAKATGYEIQYSTSSSFTSPKSVTATGTASTLSKTIASLTKGKTYYVRIRSYKTVSNVKYYSVWSATKSVKMTK